MGILKKLFSKLKYSCVFAWLFFVSTVFSQELPPITRYSATTYKAGTQNWEITFDKNNFAYFANNEGLLEFNGTEWTLYPSPNESIMRTVLAVGNKIYSGCYMEFGVWNRATTGKLRYTSLSKKIKKYLQEDEQFWNIISDENFILFQSFQRIYIYDTKTEKFKIVKTFPYIFKCFTIDNHIVFQSIGKGLFEIVDGKIKPICSDSRIKNNRITEIYTSKQNWLLQTEKAGIFKLENNVIQPFTFNDAVTSNTVFCSKKLKSGDIALGTISNGLFIITPDGKTKYHFTQSKGLGNNTILSINEDAFNNLWLGLDNGIVCLNLNSAITHFKDEWGTLGTVYTAIVHNNYLYLGTNQGLYYRSINSNVEFTIIPETKGQVWSLQVFNNQLFCCHDLGTFAVNGTNAKLIYSKSGTWKLEANPADANSLIQGNYNGLSLIENTGNQWQFKQKIEGLDISCRYFECVNHKIFICHEYKGVIEANANNTYTKIEKYHYLSNLSKGKNIALEKYRNVLYFIGKEGVFEYSENKDKFLKNKDLTAIFNLDQYVSGKMSIDKSNTLWLFGYNSMYRFLPSSFNKKLNINKIPIPQSVINPMLGYENIAEISKNVFLIGKTDGYLVLDLNKFLVENTPLYITKVAANKIGESQNILEINDLNELNYKENNITINYTIAQYNPFVDVQYSYMLEGQQNEWSTWNHKSSSIFKNLEPGDYVFKVKAKIANTTLNTIKTFKFTINQPWYFNIWAKLFYLILAILLFYYINKFYKEYYKKQREKLIDENNRLLEIAALEHEKEVMTLKNQQLEQDVTSINKELAVSTLSLMKKDELLKIIQEDLKKTVEEQSGSKLKSVISTINQNIKQENTWNTFKEAFDSVDKDFLKRIKKLHPSLTPSDLKLCAYLRLNLSSKEIAPLFNISIRSVEIKRYRLRKKLNLLHDDGLVNYILSV